MNAIETISQQLEAFFAEQDAKIADGDVQWALGRRDALQAFKKTEEYAKHQRRLQPTEQLRSRNMATALDTLANMAPGINAYPLQGSARMHSSGRAFLRRLAADLGLEKGTFDIRSNQGGIAVSGEVTLHADRIYVQLSESCAARGGVSVMFRRCDGRKDYCGRMNHFASMKDVKASYAAFLGTVGHVMQEP